MPDQPDYPGWGRKPNAKPIDRRRPVDALTTRPLPDRQMGLETLALRDPENPERGWKVNPYIKKYSER